MDRTLCGIPIAGEILNATPGQKYWSLITFTGACYLAALLLFVAARVRVVGWGLRRVY